MFLGRLLSRRHLALLPTRDRAWRSAALDLRPGARSWETCLCGCRSVCPSACPSACLTWRGDEEAQPNVVASQSATCGCISCSPLHLSRCSYTLYFHLYQSPSRTNRFTHYRIISLSLKGHLTYYFVLAFSSLSTWPWPFPSHSFPSPSSLNRRSNTSSHRSASGAEEGLCLPACLPACLLAFPCLKKGQRPFILPYLAPSLHKMLKKQYKMLKNTHEPAEPLLPLD